MKRSPLVGKVISEPTIVAHGRQLIHVLEDPADSPQNPFIGDFLIRKGSKNLYVKNKDGMWVKVDRRMSVYQDVIARLYEEGIDLVDGDDW